MRCSPACSRGTASTSPPPTPSSAGSRWRRPPRPASSSPRSRRGGPPAAPRGSPRCRRCADHAAGGRRPVTLTVAGAYHDPSHVFADQALVSAETMERLDPGAATVAVLVRGGDEEDLARAVADVPGVEVLDRAAYVKTAADAMTSGMLVIYGFIGMALVPALFGMATTGA